MTGPEHIVAWIESSKPHYDRLLELEQDRKADCRLHAYIAQRALGLATDAYREAVRDGDMFSRDHTPDTLLDAAKALLVWELEQ